MDTSVYSFVAVTRAFRAQLEAAAAKRQGTSSVMTLTFDGSQRVVPGYGVMGPAKGALEACARYMAVELGPSGLRVNSISAGPINTLAARGIPNFTRLRQQAVASAPLHEPLDARHVGDMAAFLASDAAAAVTGQTLFVDSGASLVTLSSPPS
mmetsp:Transcript_14446/g.36585  ORF Transcript_14446/g.36585 Transcript_14446/m.36585 type:complete len:153 (+) Transcript_14446:527-985(+)